MTTDKLAGIKPGDTVEVTLRGKMVSYGGRGGPDFEPDGSPHYAWMFSDAVCASPHFTIKRIEPELKVGDRVRLDTEDSPGTILAICAEDAWIKWDHLGRAQDWELTRLRRFVP